MCGLVASFSLEENGFSVDEFNMFESAMVFNQARGDDSTGIVCVDNEGVWSYVKDIGGYRNLTKQPEWGDLRHKILNRGRLAFGHGRWATRGTVTIENAHPFAVKKEDTDEKHSLVFIHNGTLEWNQSLPDFSKFKVDSEWLAKMIAVHGAEKALSEMNGAAACMWWNVEDQKFYFYRNSERPLYWMQDKKGRFWLNSEKAILEFLNFKAGLKVPDKEIYMLKEDLLFSVVANGEQMGDLKDVKIKKAPKVVYHKSHIYHNGYSGGIWDDDLDDYSVWRRERANFTAPVTALSSPWLPVEDKEFWDRDVETIEWIEKDKVITYRNKSVVRVLDSPPPEPGLVRMYEVQQDGNVMKVFSFPGQANPTYVKVYFDEWKRLHNKVPPDVKKPEENKPIGNVSKNGTAVRWSSRLAPGNKKVKHRGEIQDGQAYPYLKNYANSEDGYISLGEEVTVEMLWIEKTGLNRGGYHDRMLKVNCGRIKEKQDCYIDFRFFTHTMTQEEVAAKRFFKGKVVAIRIKTKEEIDESGAVILVSLGEVKPVTEAEPVVVSAVKAEEAPNAKTVH